tara:strand:- start:1534 stop:2235 length:702 start_codon:yes stop_codon:yes gene_type:complete
MDTNINEEFQVAARTLVSHHYLILVDNIVNLFSDLLDVKVKDPYLNMTSLINSFKKSDTLNRHLYHNLSYLRKHYNDLRHTTIEKYKFRKEVINSVVHNLDTLIVTLKHISTYEHRDTKTVSKAATDFYIDYLNLTEKYNLNVPLTPLAFSGIKIESNIEVPPNGQTIQWYKSNGYSRFVKTNVFVIGIGKRTGLKASLVRFNGKQNVVKLIETGENIYLPSKYTITFPVLDN